MFNSIKFTLTLLNNGEISVFRFGHHNRHHTQSPDSAGRGAWRSLTRINIFIFFPVAVTRALDSAPLS